MLALCHDTAVRCGWATAAGDPLGNLGEGDHSVRQHSVAEATLDRPGDGHGEPEAAGCRTVYVDGSFVTSKESPNDFDACWEEAGVDPELLDPVLLRFDAGRAEQKAIYLGELFPASIGATVDGTSFREFFQTDRAIGRAKSIVAVDLRGL